MEEKVTSERIPHAYYLDVLRQGGLGSIAVAPHLNGINRIRDNSERRDTNENQTTNHTLKYKE